MSNLSVLIVDDDIDTAINISDILVDFGYTTNKAHDGESALHLAEQNQYDVILLDFKMPGMDGATLFRRIKKLQPYIVAIMISCFARSDDVERAIEAGVRQVMRKPVDVGQLLELIKTTAEQPLVLAVDDKSVVGSMPESALRRR